MAKKGQNVKTGFVGTYDCFPSPTENQGKNTVGGDIKKSRNNASEARDKASVSPLYGVGSANDSVAPNAFPKIPALGQSKIQDGDAMRKQKPTFGSGGGAASYKAGGYGKS